MPTYRNVGLDTESDRFRRLYTTVIDVVNELAVSGEVEISFHTARDLSVWRRRAYEYQSITGVAFRIESKGFDSLVIRPPHDARTPAAPPIIKGKPLEAVRKVEIDLPHFTEEDEAAMAAIGREALKLLGETPTKDPTFEEATDILKKDGGSHDDDTRRSEPGGDGVDNGTPPGDDSDDG